MPMNESSGIRRSNLTKQQRLEAEAAIYGHNMNEEPKPITREELEKMRAILKQHDQEAGIQEFDLNKPPSGVVGPGGQVLPYSYKPYPKALYNHTKRETIVVDQPDQDGISRVLSVSSDRPLKPGEVTQFRAGEKFEGEKLKGEWKPEPFAPSPVPPREYDMILGADNLQQGSVLDRDASASKHDHAKHEGESNAKQADKSKVR